MRTASCFRRTAIVAIVSTLVGCGGSSGLGSPATLDPGPLRATDLNLIFVVSPDLAYHDPGDVDAETANLTPQGLVRSLRTATFLQDEVLGGASVTRIYALAPVTHPQTADGLPDMAALGAIEHFAVLNPITLSTDGHGANASAAFSYPVNASYASGHVPDGVATPSLACPHCQGLDFGDPGAANEALVAELVAARAPGYHVFSAPWETTRRLLEGLDQAGGYGLALPASYPGGDRVLAVSIGPTGAASLATFVTGIEPPATYPELPGATLGGAACAAQPPFTLTVTAGRDGAVRAAGSNTHETLHLVRHADAHPTPYFADGNFVAAGEWRALALPWALAGKVHPDEVISIDPSQPTQGTVSAWGDSVWSNLAPAATVEPYAVASGLPYRLVTSFGINDPDSARRASDLFFTGGRYSGRAVLVAWQYVQIPELVNALLASHGAAVQAPSWPATDYDTIWTVTLDGAGDVTVSNELCEGIDSASLPAMPPRF